MEKGGKAGPGSRGEEEAAFQVLRNGEGWGGGGKESSSALLWRR